MHSGDEVREAGFMESVVWQLRKILFALLNDRGSAAGDVLAFERGRKQLETMRQAVAAL